MGALGGFHIRVEPETRPARAGHAGQKAARGHGQGVKDLGHHRLGGDGGFLQVIALDAQPLHEVHGTEPRGEALGHGRVFGVAQAFEDLGRQHRDIRVDQKRMEVRQVRERAHIFADAAHPCGHAGQAHGHIRAQRRGALRHRFAGDQRQRLQRGRRIGRPAAQTRRVGQVLFKRDCAGHADHRRRTVHEVGGIRGHARGQGPGDIEGHGLGRFDADPVADISEHHKAVQKVVAVIPAPCHVQRQVHFGRGKDLNHLLGQRSAAALLLRTAPRRGRSRACGGCARARDPAGACPL